MATEKKTDINRPTSKGDQATDKEADAPAWANGLKQLYDSVVDEPLPDTFLELLEKFDKEPGDEAKGEDSADTPGKPA